MNLKAIFIDDEPRLRTGWRLVLQTTILITLATALGIPLVLISWVWPQAINNLFLLQILELIAITGSVFLSRWLIDQRSISSLGLKFSYKTLTDLLFGIAIAFVMMTAIYLIQLAAGWLTFDGFAWQGNFI